MTPEHGRSDSTVCDTCVIQCVIHGFKTLFTVLFIGLPLEAIYTTYNEMVCD